MAIKKLSMETLFNLREISYQMQMDSRSRAERYHGSLEIDYDKDWNVLQDELFGFLDKIRNDLDKMKDERRITIELKYDTKLSRHYIYGKDLFYFMPELLDEKMGRLIKAIKNVYRIRQIVSIV